MNTTEILLVAMRMAVASTLLTAPIVTPMLECLPATAARAS